MSKFGNAIALAAGLSAMLVVDAQGGIRVLLLGDNDPAGWVEDVRAKIQATGRVDATFDIFNNDGGGVPALETLKSYDVVVVWTDGGLDDGVGLGNVLADYVDAGGAVVEATFGFFTGGIGIQGRWLAAGYTTMTCTAQTTGAATLGARLVPGHPILRGLGGFSGGSSSYRGVVTLTPGTYRIADWSDGLPLVATNHGHAGKVTGLNFYPPSSDVRGDFWDASTGGGVLLANAINFSADNTGDVLICGAPAGGAPWAADVRDRLLEGGRVGGRVDLFDLSSGSPSLATLMDYDAVIVYTDAGSANPVALGDNLADYVDRGGGVTVSAFATWFGVAGRFAAGGYMPINASGYTVGAQTLGARHIPAHPLLENVGAFSGGTSSYRTTGAVAAGAFRIADWSDGTPLLAAMPGHKGRVAALNFYPVSSVARADMWDQSTDGSALLGNAVAWTARRDNDVLILGDDAWSGTQADIRAKLRPMVDGTVRAYDYTGPIPSIAALRRFDSVLVYADVPSSDNTLLGDRLADFVDGGGGVVDMYATASNGWAIGGRWASAGYSGLLTGSIVFGGPLTMGSKLFPLHPVLDHVASVNIGAGGYHNDGGVRPGALELATLSNGRPLAVEHSSGSGRVVSLNYFPASSDSGLGTWDPSTDAGRLMANALNHAARSDINALLVSTDNPDSEINTDARRKINQTNRMRHRIDAVDNSGANPAPGLLAAYDSVMLWARFGQPDADALGNMLAVYARNGGGVVTTYGTHFGAPYSIAGLWAARPFTPVFGGSGGLTAPGATIGLRQSPEHPTLSGINTFAFGGTGLYDALGTTRVGQRIADLSNGRPLVSEAKVPGARQSLNLNMLISSTDGHPAGWNPATRGGLLMANALTYVANERPCLIDFNSDGFVDFFDYDDYVACFESGVCPPGRDADINGDGFVDFFDYDAFVAGFELGC